jgi:hypothetical protein
MLPLVVGLVLSSPPALAANCDGYVRQAESAEGAALVGIFEQLVACDKDKASSAYKDAFLRRAADLDTLHALSMSAINADVWTPVWKQLEYVKDYSLRNEVTVRVGEECTDNPKIVKFLESSYLALRDIEFERWKKAFVACGDPGLAGWMQGQVEKPPAKQFDEKFNALVGIYTEKARADALSSLTKGAITAADNGGPFDTILMQMDAAVTPPLGGEMSAADERALEESLVEVATNVSIEKAKTVADRLANAGAEEAAARLLPRIYTDRIQAGSRFLYGAASIEAGDCAGEKAAVIHVAQVTDPGKRWNVLKDVESPMRGLKPKLKKCSSEGEWSVATTPEPLKNAKAMEDWIGEIEKNWADKGYSVKVSKEKGIDLN